MASPNNMPTPAQLCRRHWVFVHTSEDRAVDFAEQPNGMIHRTDRHMGYIEDEVLMQAPVACITINNMAWSNDWSLVTHMSRTR